MAVLTIQSVSAGSATPYLIRGWQALSIDNDAEALRCFGVALNRAEREANTSDKALSLLYMGIGSYGTSYSRGLEYATLAMAEYQKMERADPAAALEGRSRCLQLISTIYSRQGKYRQAILLSRRALAGFPTANDSTGTLGLIFNSFGTAYQHLGNMDSAVWFYRRALAEQRQTRHVFYLPASYINIADAELDAGHPDLSLAGYNAALKIADSTGNRQGQVVAWLGLSRWRLHANDVLHAEAACSTALHIAAGLTDKSFELKALERLLLVTKQQQDFKKALDIQTAINVLTDSLRILDKQRTVESLEVQFEVAEKDRQLRLTQQQGAITKLTNYMLWGAIIIISLICSGIILFLRRMARKDKLLLLRKDELMYAQDALHAAQEAQHRLAAQQLEADLEHKESQLTALTMQMLQKAELLHELKEQLEKDSATARDGSLTRIINKGLNHDKDWADFNTYFESINRNFYTRLKQTFPDISPNDLKICALIKLNLSIKEMAGILNISPDSVKTARYRLRKKLGLATEDNLTDFILQL